MLIVADLGYKLRAIEASIEHLSAMISLPSEEDWGQGSESALVPGQPDTSLLLVLGHRPDTVEGLRLGLGSRRPA